MSKKLTLLTLLFASLPALAQFEGVIDMKMTITDKDGTSLGGGTTHIAIAKAGTRSEMNMQRGPTGIKMVILQKSDTPDKIYNLNEAAHSYTEIDLAKMRAMANQQQQPKIEFTVQKLGQEKVLGYDTQHVLVKQKNAAGEEGITTEMWTAKDFMDYATFSRLQARQGRASQESLVKALKEADAEGMPLKSVATAPDGSKTTVEVVKAEKQSLPASTFEIPAGYTKSEGGMMDMMRGSMTGPQAEEQRQKMEEAKKKMNEALKNMTPEQRQMFENMMKQRGAQQ